MQSQALQAPDMMADDVLPVMRLEILIPQLTVGDFVTQDKVGGLSKTVCHHDRRSLLAFPTGKPTTFGAEIRPLRVARGVRTCDEDRPEPLVTFAGPPTLALAGTLIVARADLGPGAEMLGRGKPRHVDADFRDQVLGRPLTDARDRVEERDDLGERAAQHLDLGFTRGDTLFEKLDMGQDVREQRRLVGPQAPQQSGLEVWLLLPQAAFRQVRSRRGAHDARQQGRQDGAT
jgi:hypothetical protein